MKILLTGGGSGGHFYPIIAVAQAIRKLAEQEKLVDVKLYYMAPQPYDRQLLFDNDITFVKSSAGKMRRYFSILNFFDIFRTAFGILHALWSMYDIYPDVVFGKGGYVSFPALVAARFFRIPVVIHESDSVPGRLNRWAGKFAQRVAVSYPEAAEFFPKKKVAFTGNPIRRELMNPVKEGSIEFLKLEIAIPVILILGGSQGSRRINDAILDSLTTLVQKYQIIHQTGDKNYNLTKETARVVLEKSIHKGRYHPYASIDALTMRMAAGAASLVISRAGSTIFEVAAWGIPSIIIPIESSNGDHQQKNAFIYSATGAAEVVEEANLTANILISEVEKILGDPARQEMMKKAALGFSRGDSASLIAQEIIVIGLEHD